jgi:hypothetical protein
VTGRMVWNDFRNWHTISPGGRKYEALPLQTAKFSIAYLSIAALDVSPIVLQTRNAHPPNRSLKHHCTLRVVIARTKAIAGKMLCKEKKITSTKLHAPIKPPHPPHKHSRASVASLFPHLSLPHRDPVFHLPHVKYPRTLLAIRMLRCRWSTSTSTQFSALCRSITFQCSNLKTATARKHALPRPGESQQFIRWLTRWEVFPALVRRAQVATTGIWQHWGCMCVQGDRVFGRSHSLDSHVHPDQPTSGRLRARARAMRLYVAGYRRDPST